MTIPLVTRQINLVKNNPLLGAGSPFAGSGRITDFQLAHPNFTAGHSSDAVKVSLSGKLGEASRAANLRASNGAGSGVLPGALQELGRISEQIVSIASDLNAENITPDRKSALEAERDALGSQYHSIINSESFQAALGLAKNVQGALGSGVDPNALAQSLGGSRALLGDSYLGLVGGGYYSNLQKVGSSLDTLALGDPLTFPEQAAALSSAAKNALSALSVNAPQQLTTVAAADTGSTEVVVLPKLQELQFQSGGGLTVGLRGYGGTDIIAAAAVGLPDGGAPQLILTLPKTNSEDEKSKRDAENKKTVEAKFPISSLGAEGLDIKV